MSEAPSNNDNKTFMATGNSEWDQWEHRFAPVDADIQLHFVDVGSRDATPVVLVHGWPEPWFAWRIVPRRPAGVRNQERRGRSRKAARYGSHERSPTAFAYSYMKLTRVSLCAGVDFLNLPRAVFVGHDWGSAIVWRMYRYHPERVLAVCGICTPYFPQRDQLVDVNTLAVAIPQLSYMKFLSQSVEAAKVLNVMPKRLVTATHRFPEEHEVDEVNVPYLEILQGVAGEEELDIYVREYSRSGFKGSCNYYAVRAIDFETENPLLRVIPHRALYIGAGTNKLLKPEMAAHMPHFVPNLETALVKGGGHWLLWSHRNEVTEILLNWLGKVELSDGAPIGVTP